MTPGLLAAFAGFVFVISVTPGPNNAMLLAAGAHHGLRRAVPQILGIGFGCMAMLGAAGMGLGEVFRRVPALYDVLRIVGGAYLLWLAWCIAAARPDGEGARAGRPLSFLESALFQWVNPKAWIMAVGAVSAYAPRDALAGHVAVLALIMGVVGIACATIWAAFGSALRPLLTDARRLRLFNLAMAGLLVLSLGSLLAG